MPTPSRSAARGSPAITGALAADAIIRAACDTVRQRRDWGCRHDRAPTARSPRAARKGWRRRCAASRPRREGDAPPMRPSRPTPQPRESGAQRAEAGALLLEVSKGLTRVADIGAAARQDRRLLPADLRRRLRVGAAGRRAREQIPKVARDRQGAAPQRSVPQSIVRTVVQDKVAILSDNAPEDVRFGGESILVQRVRSTMCAPLVGSEGRVLGVLYVDNVTSTHRVDEEDLEFLAAFAGIAAVAIEQRAVLRAHSARAARAEQLRALLRAQSRGADRGRRRAPSAWAATSGPSPCSSATSAGSRRCRNR